MTQSQHVVLHEAPGLLTDYIAVATKITNPLEMEIHSDNLQLCEAGVTVGLTIG